MAAGEAVPARFSEARCGEIGLKERLIPSEPLILGLLGYPLEHSLSPRLHQAALRAAGVAGDYQSFAVPPEAGAGPLSDLMDRLRSRAVHGINVTIPYKQVVQRYLDRRTPPAAAVGAVNTVFWERGELVGDNTDIAGFRADLEPLHLPEAGLAIVLGAGGAARAVVYALLTAGWRVVLAARRTAQAARVSQDLSGHGPGREDLRVTGMGGHDLAKAAAGCDLIVNATPVGMHPDINASPWASGVPLPAKAAVYDLVYNPVETALFKQARAAGLPARTGLGMLVEQAALAFERWTAVDASRQAMWAAVSDL